MAVNTAAPVFASSTGTASGALADASTIAIGGKTYTTQTSLTNTDGHILIGANQTATIANIISAINLTSGAGTTYATAMTKNSAVRAFAATATTVTIKAKIPGAIGNSVATTDNQANFAWTSTVLAGGTGDIADYVEGLLSLNQLNSEAMADLKVLTLDAD